MKLENIIIDDLIYFAGKYYMNFESKEQSKRQFEMALESYIIQTRLKDKELVSKLRNEFENSDPRQMEFDFVKDACKEKNS
jgi:serine protease inhibitor